METGLFASPRYRIAGDRGLLVEYGDRIDLDINGKVRTMAMLLEDSPLQGIVEVIPTYRSLLLIYDPLQSDPGRIRTHLENLEERMGEITIPPPRTVEIPVCYGGEFGPDIEFVARAHDLSVDEVVRLHAATPYPIYMIGFTPGFPFLGGLPETLHTPRLETPRTRVPAGSVGIANGQTGVYPVDSPGGWRIIGRTPLKLFDAGRENPFLYRAGDRIRFVPVDEAAFQEMADGEDV
jgi:KipI family sensor histidine kinase inhibitor